MHAPAVVHAVLPDAAPLHAPAAVAVQVEPDHVHAPDPPAALAHAPLSDASPQAVACVASHDSVISVTSAVYVHEPAPTQFERLVDSSAGDINDPSAQSAKSVAAHASATTAANAVNVQPPDPSHVASFSLSVPLIDTDEQPDDASSSYRPEAQSPQLVAPAAEYLPSVQATHSVAALLSASARPAMHVAHAVEPAAEY